MDWNKRQDDLTRVFDARYKANHNDDVKRAREKERQFINKLFNVRENPNQLNNTNHLHNVRSSREEGLERLNNNMQSLRNQQQNNYKNFGNRNNW